MSISKSSGSKVMHLVVRSEIKKEFDSILGKVNKKKFGRRVRGDELLKKMMALFKPEHLKELQEESFSNTDRIELQCQKFLAENEHAKRDEFMSELLSGWLLKSKRKYTRRDREDKKSMKSGN